MPREYKTIFEIHRNIEEVTKKISKYLGPKIITYIYIRINLLQRDYFTKKKKKKHEVAYRITSEKYLHINWLYEILNRSTICETQSKGLLIKRTNERC